MRPTATALAALLLAVSGPVLAKPATPAVTVTVDATKPGPVINRHIFGQFAEHLGEGIYGGIWVGKDSPIPNTRGIRNDVVAALKAIKVPNVRWPGGCFADEYNWRRGIGPQSDRKPAVNSNWGGVVEPNSFGTDEFFDFAAQVGTEAYVSVNVGSSTPMDAAEWMEYMTSSTDDAMGQMRAANGHPEPYKVAFLGLGNEAWGCGGSMTPEHYVDVMKPFARFAHNYNPAQPMQRIAVGPDGAKPGYTEAVMKAWKDHDWAWNIEGISLHSYTVGKAWPPSVAATGFDQSEYALMLKSTLAMEGLVTTHGAIMDKYDPEKKVGLIVDEWGAWLAKTPGSQEGFLIQQNSQRDALLAALNINIFARHADRVRGANIAQMVNVLQAMIFTKGPKMVLTPTYHVFAMYVPFQDATFVPVKYDPGTYTHGDITLPRLDAIAAKAKDGKVWLSLTNLDPTQPLEVDAAALGFTAKTATGQVLTSPKIDSVNDFDHPDTVTPKAYSAKVKGGKLILVLPPESVTVVSLD